MIEKEKKINVEIILTGRAGSVARELESPVEPQKALDLLLKEMTQFYRTLAMFGTDPELITQVFRQVGIVKYKAITLT